MHAVSFDHVDSGPSCLELEPRPEASPSPRLAFMVPEIMKAARKNGTKKARGRPATGQGVQVGTRWSEATVAAIDAWSEKQGDRPGRSEAIRRLVEIGLRAKK
jgi:hypothetical protein